MMLKPILPVLDYIVNYEYISKVLCVNKDKPKMHCNGKCHLMRELAKAEESEKPISSDKKGNSQTIEVLFFQEVKTFQITDIFFQSAMKTNAEYSNLYFYLNPNSVFRPPTSIS